MRHRDPGAARRGTRAWRATRRGTAGSTTARCRSRSSPARWRRPPRRGTQAPAPSTLPSIPSPDRPVRASPLAICRKHDKRRRGCRVRDALGRWLDPASGGCFRREDDTVLGQESWLARERPRPWPRAGGRRHPIDAIYVRRLFSLSRLALPFPMSDPLHGVPRNAAPGRRCAAHRGPPGSASRIRCGKSSASPACRAIAVISERRFSASKGSAVSSRPVW